MDPTGAACRSGVDELDGHSAELLGRAVGLDGPEDIDFRLNFLVALVLGLLLRRHLRQALLPVEPALVGPVVEARGVEEGHLGDLGLVALVGVVLEVENVGERRVPALVALLEGKRAGVIPKPELKQQKITGSDKFIVLASDGVWDYLDNQKVVDIAAKHINDPRRASSEIVKQAREQWGRQGPYIDDITALVVKL